jgi:two-component system chemotaxis response regulator CheY
MRILIVEDDPGTRLIVEASVKKLGHEPTAFAEGEAALACFSERDFDVVLCDRLMPGMSGDELCRRVRADPTGRYPYFIFLTGLTERSAIESGMQQGADDYLSKPLNIQELSVRLVVAERITALHRKLALQKGELQRLNATLFEQARIDPLTKLHSRLRFNEDLEQLWPRVERYGERYCAIMCDIDNFKQYNDTYGHLAGDEVLKRVADALIGVCRGGDRIYRFGGEEFVIVLSGCTLEGGIKSAERYRSSIESLEIPHSGSAFGIVTASLGVASLRAGTGATVEGWIGEADTALYEAKRAGRNQVAARAELQWPEQSEGVSSN